MSTAIKDDALYIADMLDEIGNITDFTSGIGKEEFLKNTMAKRAVERSIQIIGEAAKALSDDFKGRHPEIEWRKIIAMRNFITHAYGEVDHETVWEVVKHDIPELKQKLLDGLDRDSPPPHNKREIRGQGATQLAHAPTYCPLQGQGATEYLVLLAVVLIVALVSVALLGFFPGMASDAQITQSQAYWQSASPIAIVEAVARYDGPSSDIFPYIRMRNTGAYPLRITGVVGADGGTATIFQSDPDLCGRSSGFYNINDYFYMAPGEEKYFLYRGGYGYPLPCDGEIRACTGASTGYYVGGASSLCQNSNSTPGTLAYNSFGFRYIEYIDGQQITKRQVGKGLIVKCQPPR